MDLFDFANKLNFKYFHTPGCGGFGVESQSGVMDTICIYLEDESFGGIADDIISRNPDIKFTTRNIGRTVLHGR